MLKGLKRLHQFENRILNILTKAGKLGSIKQIGYSRINKDGFRFPISAITLGTAAALKNRSVVLVGGVHGLETIGIRILLDFLTELTTEKTYRAQLASGEFAVCAVPVLNPGGVANRTRSNPAGIDLMRNSGVKAEAPLPFFGGQNVTRSLPYFRGRKLEPESIALFRYLRGIYNPKRKTPLPVLDIHSGYGTKNFVWWPYAFTKEPVHDEQMYRNMTNYLRYNCHNHRYHYGPQSEMYTSHGDLWDLYYNHFLKIRQKNAKVSAFLPLTLEIGTWSDLLESPKRLLDKKKIFNPPKEKKKDFVKGHRSFLYNFCRLATMKSEFFSSDNEI